MNVDPDQITSHKLSVNTKECRDREKIDPRNKEELMDMIEKLQVIQRMSCETLIEKERLKSL